ncbi:methylenetetrahydrofolate reductase [Helicobacter sp. MIT 00-7814]|uniref:methylenetetrahydrofolate reductase n=1 Tax=unclassified Helicobacter TaxID=2593540 RepID=UPI000E1F2F7C|nr:MULTISPECIES: methylenetetrahydrofolate reductase [unclassified Helicobacter]RDU53034.1 methylenetetrahydrofolate reductase [Helicobacter sp. MIT 99-10781]RDU55323.1 methylenetetrahydrofolate reductase [Helicobacter sp. MIT 00-7814]
MEAKNLSVDLESLIAKLHTNAPFLSLEITPPLSGKIEVDSIKELKNLDYINAFVCTDSPLARFKPSSILSSLKLQNFLQKPLICTLSMRDRNSIALCGDILAVNELGVRAFLSLTGDSIKLGDCIESKGVFEDNSLKLARIIDTLNSGYGINHKPLSAPVQKIYNFHVINSYANNMESLKTKLAKKLSNSDVEGFFTQPVYDEKSGEFLLKSLERLNSEYGRKSVLIFGFYPILSYKTALFLRDKLPGVFVPESLIESLESASKISKQEEEKVGFEQSVILLQKLQKLNNKIHFMNPQKIALFAPYFRV